MLRTATTTASISVKCCTLVGRASNLDAARHTAEMDVVGVNSCIELTRVACLRDSLGDADQDHAYIGQQVLKDENYY